MLLATGGFIKRTPSNGSATAKFFIDVGVNDVNFRHFGDCIMPYKIVKWLVKDITSQFSMSIVSRSNGIHVPAFHHNKMQNIFWSKPAGKGLCRILFLFANLFGTYFHQAIIYNHGNILLHLSSHFPLVPYLDCAN